MTWPIKKLNEVLEYEQPTKYLVSSTDYKEEYLTPVLTAGKSFVLGNTNEKNGIFPKEKLPVIIFDDFTTAIKFVDFPFKVKSSAMKILHAKKNVADIRYTFYKMLTMKFSHAQHKRYWISECSNIKIPLPPLAIQKQIVERLDKIAETQKMNDGLIKKTDELFQSLLHKELNPAGKDWEVKKLVEVADFLDNLRKPVTASDRVSGPYPYYGANGQQDSVGDYIFDDELVLLAEDGGYFGSKTRPVAYRVSGKCWINNHAHVLKNKNEVSDIDFLGYSLMYYDVTPYVTGSTRAKLNKSAAEKIKIFLPSLEIQKQIVAKLSAVQDYKKQLLKQKSKLKELFDSALVKSLT